MATLNKSLASSLKSDRPANLTFEGGVAARAPDPIEGLKRVMYANLLFEDSFYIDGVESASLLEAAVRRAVAHDFDATAGAILECRGAMNIRTASLRAAVVAAKLSLGRRGVSDLIANVIQRGDEPGEVIAQAGGKEGMTHAIRRGVAKAIGKFDAYQLMKYKGDGRQFSLKDAISLTHPHRTDLLKRFMADELPAPDTWEVALSSGADKRETFERLLRENKLGAMALLRNLRNMADSGADRALIAQAMARANWSRVLPFRFLSAAETAPALMHAIDTAFRKAVEGSTHLPGTTAVFIDTSGSMKAKLSAKSTVSLYRAAATLAFAVNGDDVMVGEFGSYARWLPAKGLSGAVGLRTGSVAHGTDVDSCIRLACAAERGRRLPDRVIIFTDGQFLPSSEVLPKGTKGYLVNLAAYGNLGYLRGNWTAISGFSARLLDWIALNEGAPLGKPDFTDTVE